MAALVLENLSKLYKDDAIGVRNLNLEVPEGELLVLVGPSGSGKSTTLRLIAGLERPTEGNIYIGGRLANDVPPRDRDIAMVFQDYALYPHFNVEQNMGFGLKMRGLSKHEVRSQVIKASHMLGMQDLLNRKPKELSGGQRQRVALGRALVRDPRVFLLDEPLSNLDVSLRVQLRREIKEIHRKLGATMIYVTHDQNEAMALGQRIAVMNAGLMEQVGPPEELYRSPDTRFVAGFFGMPPMNFFEGVAEIKADVLEVKCGEKSVVIKRPSNDIPERVLLGFRPEDVRLDTPPETGSLSGTARVVSVEAMGAETQIFLKDGTLDFVAKTLGYSDIQPGSETLFGISEGMLHFFDANTGKRLKIL